MSTDTQDLIEECDRLSHRLKHLQDLADSNDRPPVAVHLLNARARLNAVSAYPEAYEKPAIYGALDTTLMEVKCALKACGEDDKELGANIATTRDRLRDVLGSVTVP